MPAVVPQRLRLHCTRIYSRWLNCKFAVDREQDIGMHEQMFRSKNYLLPMLLLYIVAGWHALALADDGTSQKVIYHVNFDDAQAQQQTLRYIRNHLNAVGEEKLDLRVILHGDGLTLLLEPDMADNTLFTTGYATDELTATIAALKDRGVHFLVCANTLRGKQVDPANDLYDVDEQDIVASGVAEIARLQGQGFAYIRP